MPIPEETLQRAAVVVQRCRKIATFTERPGAITRTFLSPPMRDCHREIASWLAPLGAEVSIDAAGNLRALYPGAHPGAPRFLIGSHLDTVPNAGAFDGVLGVVIAVALVEALTGEKLPFAIEIIGFSEEEGVRFGVPFIGSRALVGTLDDLLDRKDAQGTSVRAAIERFGLDPNRIPAARLNSNGDILGYLEFHIEQGPVLEELALPLAAVEAIAGQSRIELTFAGRADHAGTTPMHSRRDALAGAAEWIVAVEREARVGQGLVATVGSIEAKPGVGNVIAGEACVSLDVRHGADSARVRAVDTLLDEAKRIASRRGLHVNHRVRFNQAATPMDAALVALIADSIRASGIAPHRMTSGAGHDAMILAAQVPSAMLFVRSPEGVSHNPAESVQTEDVAHALEAGSHLLRALAATGTPTFNRRVNRA